MAPAYSAGNDAADNPAFTVPASPGYANSVSCRPKRPVSSQDLHHIDFDRSHSIPTQPSDITSSSDAPPTNLHGKPAGVDEDADLRHDMSPSDLPNAFNYGWRRIVRNFSPSWFAVTMGTGIVAVLFNFIPYKAQWLYWLSVIFFCLNALLFAAAFSVSLLRYTLYPEIWTVMVHDPVNSLFLACAPMGFATLVEMWVFVCVPIWGSWATTLVWVLWMIDAIVAVATTVTLCFTLISSAHQTSLSSITAAQLLPIAATLVAAGAGSDVAEILPDARHAWGTIVACYVLWGIGMPMAASVLVIYYQRLAVHKLPPREVLVSSFLPLGPLGFGGYGIMYSGKVARLVLPQILSFPNPVATASTDSADLFLTRTLSSPALYPALAGEVLYVVGFLAALILWGWGLIWLVFALATIYRSRPFPFNMGWWSFTFPLGVYASSTIQLGLEMPSAFFRALGTAFGAAVILLWCVVAAGTVRGAWSGRLFQAPCLAQLRQEEWERGKRMSRGGGEGRGAGGWVRKGRKSSNNRSGGGGGKRAKEAAAAAAAEKDLESGG